MVKRALHHQPTPPLASIPFSRATTAGTTVLASQIRSPLLPSIQIRTWCLNQLQPRPWRGTQHHKQASRIQVPGTATRAPWRTSRELENEITPFRLSNHKVLILLSRTLVKPLRKVGVEVGCHYTLVCRYPWSQHNKWSWSNIISGQRNHKVQES